MSDSDVRELLSAYLDGEVSDAERLRVDEALAGSAVLRRELFELGSTRDLIRGLPDVEPRRPLQLPTPTPVTAAPRRRARRRATAVVAVAAIWLLILSVGVSLGSIPVVPDVDQLTLQHAAAATSDPETDMGFRAMTIEQMADDPAIVDDVGHGMVRDAIFQSDDTVQVRYSDGVHAVSVFHQPGRVDWDDMPGSGKIEMAGDAPMWMATMHDMDVLVLERGDLVVTVVADGDMGHEMTTMASSMVPEVDMDRSWWRRVLDAPGNLLDRF